MTMLQYLAWFIGEPRDKINRLHTSTIRRLKAFAIAMHIPVLLWSVTGFVIASEVFRLATIPAIAIAIGCALLIYLIERLVLETPKIWYVNVARLLIGLVIAVIGASTVDLVVFKREVDQQLRLLEETKINAAYRKEIAVREQRVTSTKNDWDTARAAANCEANGTCGSGRKSTGPIYRELSRQAETLRQDYVAAQQDLQMTKKGWAEAIADVRESPIIVDQSGLLSRIEALHRYTVNNRAAFAAWALFFCLVMSCEAMVIFVKMVFPETVDDQIERVREQVAAHRANSYMEAIMSPLARARDELQSVYQ